MPPSPEEKQHGGEGETAQMVEEGEEDSGVIQAADQLTPLPRTLPRI